ncbi:hypothetical protein BDK51DRAFT_49863 [Blyttiomyces helicus]|uniref:SF3 helicase domain-containing protein n=1 Tax=Blyttiomyces helicus TaxID=388810 RepID=A0A4P9VY95_9FUNG|nr:hypothetical protein BDK51DRAFT_49863 [Blyttiomyces helicus]|eukprot:RKO82746.1 hypothetical protein BDK51DRAFT_49863 [Blyttiomyces helicus]
MDLTLGPYTEGEIGITAPLLNNRECPVCKQTHSSPQNYCIVLPNSKVAIGCMCRINTFYPNPASTMTPNAMNILYAQNVQINNITVYGKGADVDVQFGEIVPIFPDDPTLNMLVFKSFTSYLDDIEDVVFHLGKDKFGIGHSFNSKSPCIMQNQDELNYLLKWLASCIDGRKKEEIFTILTGDGRNGKGVLCDLMHVTLGGLNGYSLPIQASMLTSERPSSASPCPDLLNLRGKRWACGSEPEKKKSINGEFVKFLTGNDVISGRYFHENLNVDFHPQHALVIQCNAIPTMDAEDDAIWDRGRIIDFVYKFVENPKGEFQRKIDKNLKDKVKNWGPQFMLLLIEWYNIYKNEGLQPSPSVVAKTREVRKDNDFVLEFFESNYTKTDDYNHYVLCKDVSNMWKNKQGKNIFVKPKLREAALRFGATFDKDCEIRGMLRKA